MIHMTSAYLCLTDGPRDYLVLRGSLSRISTREDGTTTETYTVVVTRAAT